MSITQLLDSSVIIIDKPPKLSSNEVSALVKKITGAKRSGHAGTLDPEVSGVLPVALGRTTKLLDYISAKDKIYVGIIKFKTLQTTEKILELFQKFEGNIVQTPPKISAVRKVPRTRVIHYIKFLEQDEKRVLFETKTQAGTYVRTLCEDIGKLVGGARMEELRRIAVGNITEDKAVKMQDLADAIWLWKEKGNPSELFKILLSPEEYLKNYPKIFIKKSAIFSFLNGVQLTVQGILKTEEFTKNERVAIYSEENEFLGMGAALVSSSELKNIADGRIVRTERIHKNKTPLPRFSLI